MNETNSIGIGGMGVLSNGYKKLPSEWSAPELLEEVDMMTDEDVIEGMDERSIEDIINEVAEEENLTPEEIRQMVLDYQKTKFQVAKKKRSKPKKIKNKNAIKQAKKSKKQNRK